MDLYERIVRLDPRPEIDLPGQLDGGHVAEIRRQPEPVDPVEEFERDTAVAQLRIERGEDHVAHPGAHLPGNGSLVVEEEPGESAQRARSRAGRLVGPAVPVREGHVIDHRGDQGAPDRLLLRPVPQKPFGIVDMVDGIDTVPQQAVGQHAADVREEQVDQVPLTAYLVRVVHQAVELRPRGVRRRVGNGRQPGVVTLGVVRRIGRQLPGGIVDEQHA